MPNNSALKSIYYWLPVIFTMAAIFYLSSIPGKEIPALFPFQDILAHVLIYAVFGFFVKRLLKNKFPGISALKLTLLTVLSGSIYGASDEFHQLFVPGRCASGIDIAADALGSLFGGLIYR